jgi:hypothetical protein
MGENGHGRNYIVGKVFIDTNILVRHFWQIWLKINKMYTLMAVIADEAESEIVINCFQYRKAIKREKLHLKIFPE